jgi:hypothetical protein
MEFSGEPGQCARAFIIGVGCDLKYARIDRQLFQGSENACRPPIFSRRIGVLISGLGAESRE